MYIRAILGNLDIVVNKFYKNSKILFFRATRKTGRGGIYEEFSPDNFRFFMFLGVFEVADHEFRTPKLRKFFVSLL